MNDYVDAEAKVGRALISVSDPLTPKMTIDQKWLTYLFEVENLGEHKITRVKIGTDSTNTFIVDFDKAKLEAALSTTISPSVDFRSPVFDKVDTVSQFAYEHKDEYPGAFKRGYKSYIYRIILQIQEQEHRVFARRTETSIYHGIQGQFEEIMVADYADTLSAAGYPLTLDI